MSERQRAELAYWLDADRDRTIALYGARYWWWMYDDLMGDHRTVIEFGSGPWPVLELFPIVERRISIDPLNTGFFAAGMHDYRYLYELHQTPEPIPDETADLVLALNMIDHTDEPRQVIAEMRRVAKPGAGLRLWTHLHKDESTLHAVIDAADLHEWITGEGWQVQGFEVLSREHDETAVQVKARAV